MLTFATIVILISLVINMARLVVSPKPEDRVIIIDIAAFQLLGMTLLLSLVDRSELPLQFAFILALLGFISTLILSRLLHTKTS